MSDADKTVFISYRRNISSFIARSVFLDLRAHGYDVFMDVESIDSGTFDTIILNQIAARGHFLIICTPGTFERCNETDDWLRREIETAIEQERNVVPVLTNGYKFESDRQFMTEGLEGLPRLNALPLFHEYFDAGMERLRDRFLKQPVAGAILPAPKSDQPVVEQKVEQVVAQAKPTQQELTAEDYLMRALARPQTDLDGKIREYSEAIQLNPNYPEAYYNRGNAWIHKSDFDHAIADYDAAIRLAPMEARAYNNRGFASYRNGEFASALKDVSTAIALDNQESAFHDSLGQIHLVLSKFPEAISEFEAALKLDPTLDNARAGLAIALHALGDIKKSHFCWKIILDSDPRYRDADWVGEELNWRPELIEAARKLIAELDD